MSNGVNSVIIIGNLGKDVEMRAMPAGKQVANFSVATTEVWKDKQTGEKQEATEWHSIVAFDRLAEICGQYLTKGSKVYVAGKLKTRNWEDQESGKKMYRTDIIANTMQMLDSRQQQADNHNQPAQQPAQQPQQAPAGDFKDFDDDIPF